MDIGKDIYSSARESCCGYPTNWPFGLGFRAEYACVFPRSYARMHASLPSSFQTLELTSLAVY
ncbi:hypothetical protein SCLCIDRAFT_745645 [Scleroderma citrinum Foug A]|uniref:Uncharacterized protein n=1 Tax=Scleroderma citrinum Foug A TaxID=1036808 RepID=A0A0C3AEW8_9AGAM|nr:hypothetical protein SCLCIDRAFT_745645 [Scleroderma citrinum Foug A]